MFEVSRTKDAIHRTLSNDSPTHHNRVGVIVEAQQQRLNSQSVYRVLLQGISSFDVFGCGKLFKADFSGAEN